MHENCIYNVAIFYLLLLGNPLVFNLYFNISCLYVNGVCVVNLSGCKSECIVQIVKYGLGMLRRTLYKIPNALEIQ